MLISVFARSALVGLSLTLSAPDLLPSNESRDYEASAYISGLKDGLRDLERGTLAFESFGWPPESCLIYRRMLLDRYGIKERRVAGCCPGWAELGHAAGYNTVIIPEIIHRFGSDVLERTALDADRVYEETTFQAED